jgi:Na+/H+ antiporter NhaD/arsenite permease-like protein
MNRLIKIFILTSLFLFALETISYGVTSAASSQDSIVTTIQSTTANHQLPNPLIVIPFVLLLLIIATGPVFYRHFWEHNYARIAIFLGLITVSYYLFILRDSNSLIHTLAEYLSFIALLSSLFVASGGILIKVDKKSTPLLNVGILLFGALISNLIGTTGASMLLIRPYIKINRDRVSAYHIIFFIFIVSNIGGSLTPIGDPPLFLGFLRGVPFFWVIGAVWFIWLPVLILLLLIFYFVDSRNKTKETEPKTYSGKIEFKGLKNLVYLVIILISVFIDPAIISWVPSLYPLPFGIREIIMFAVVFISFKTADKSILKANEFNFEPIKEVAYLFVGIFATMIPALQLISNQAREMGEKLNQGIFYWATGFLSAFLDNAPTYLNFLSASMGKYGLDVNTSSQVIQFTYAYESYLTAISIAAVFFGAMTYIGNGPNFMVRTISEQAGISMPSFFVYFVKYAVPILLPIFVLVWLVFFI